MKLPLCAKCRSYLRFFVPEKQEANRFWHRCDECGFMNELAVDTASSGESKLVFKVIGILTPDVSCEAGCAEQMVVHHASAQPEM